MGDALKKLTEEEKRKAFRRKVFGDFVKYYNMITDEEAFTVEKIISDTIDRFRGKNNIEKDGCKEIH